MTRMTWGDSGSRYYEGGVDRGVLYVEGAYGVPWNGLVQVTEKPTGGDATAYWLDGQKYYVGVSSEEFEGTIEAYYSPPEFDACDGSLVLGLGLYARQQKRKEFGLSYRTKLGNDIDGIDYGYKLHLIYNAHAQPSSKDYKSLSDSVDPNILSWDITTKALNIPGGAPTAHIIIDMSEAHAELQQALEDILYGNEIDAPRLPTPDELVDLFAAAQYLIVVDNGDGTATITGPDDVVFKSIDPTVVVPQVPVYDENTQTVDIPVVTGVVYTIDGVTVTGTVPVTSDTTIMASPAPGYSFIDGLDQMEVWPTTFDPEQSNVWTVSYPSVIALSSDTYQISSL